MIYLYFQNIVQQFVKYVFFIAVIWFYVIIIQNMLLNKRQKSGEKIK